MAFGQRGRGAPQGKLASNLSITDLSYTAPTDMRWGNLCIDSVMLLHTAMIIYHKTTQSSPQRANVLHDKSKNYFLVIDLKHPDVK